MSPAHGNENGRYRESRWGVYPDVHEWRWQVVAPDGATVNHGGYADKQSAQKAARREARFRDRLERDRVDGVRDVRTDRVLERGVCACRRCGKPHDLVATTRRGRRWGQTWAAPDGHTYESESWEETARRMLDQPQVAA